MANVGGVMFVSSEPGIPTIVTGYQPIHVIATKTANETAGYRTAGRR